MSPPGPPAWPEVFAAPHALDSFVPPHDPPSPVDALMDRERFADTLVDILRAAARRDGVEV
jgi:hypothetical protein